MKKWWVIGVIAVVILILIILGMYFLLGRSDDYYFNLYNCEKDSDCMTFKADCCGCSAGGKATAINKDYKNKWEDDLAESCAATTCIAVMSDDPSCSAQPKCVNNKCSLNSNQYTCPTNTGYINCMPSPDAMKENTVCHGEYHDWVVKNCPGVKFAV